MADNRRITIDVEVEADGAIRVLDRTGSSASQLGKTVEGTGSSFSRAGVALIAFNQGLELLNRISGSVTAVFHAITEEGKGSEHTLALLQSRLGKNVDAINKYGRAISLLERRTSKTEQEIAAGAAEIANARWNNTTREIEALNASTELAVALFGDVGQAANLVTSAIGAYGEAYGDADEIANKFFKTITGNRGSMDQMNASFKQVLQVASQLGVNLDELLAIYATMTKNNIEAGAAAATLRGIMQALLKPSADMLLLLQTMEQTTGAGAVQTYGLAKTITNLTDAADGNEEALARAIGKLQSFAAVQVVAKDGGAEVTEQLKRLRNEENELGDTLDVVNQRYDEQLKRIENLKGELREVLFYAARKDIDAWTDAVERANRQMLEFTEANPTMARVTVDTFFALSKLAGLASSLGTFAATIGIITIAWPGFGAGAAAAAAAVARAVPQIAALVTITAGLKWAGDRLHEFAKRWTVGAYDVEAAGAKLRAEAESQANMPPLFSGIIDKDLIKQLPAQIDDLIAGIAQATEQGNIELAEQLKEEAEGLVRAGLSQLEPVTTEVMGKVGEVAASAADVFGAEALSGIDSSISAYDLLIEKLDRIADATAGVTSATSDATKTSADLAGSYRLLEQRLQQIKDVHEPLIAARKADYDLAKRQYDLAVATNKPAAEIATAAKAVDVAAAAAGQSVADMTQEMLDFVEATAPASPYVEQLSAQLRQAKFEAAGVGEYAAKATDELKKQADEVGKSSQDAVTKLVDSFKIQQVEARRAVDEQARQVDVLREMKAPQEVIQAAIEKQVSLLGNERDLYLQIAAALERVLATLPRGSDEARNVALAILEARNHAQDLGDQAHTVANSFKEASETIRFSLTDAFRQGMRDSIDAVVQGTRDLKDVWEGVKVSMIGSFADAFAGILVPKKLFDFEMERNAAGVADTWDGAGGAIMGTFQRVFKFGQEASKQLLKYVGGDFMVGNVAASTILSGAGVGGGIGGILALLTGGSQQEQLGTAIGGAIGGAIGSYVASAATTAALANVGITSVGGLMTNGVAAGAGGILGSSTAASFGATAGLAVIFAVIGHMIGSAFTPKIADEVKKDTRDALTKLLVKTLGIIDETVLAELGRGKIISKTVPTLGDRLEAGLPVSDIARVLALVASKGDSPFDEGRNRRMFSIWGGQIQSILEDFPDQADAAAKAIAQAYGGNLGDAIDKMQAQIIKILDDQRERVDRRSIFEDRQGMNNRYIDYGVTQQEALQELIDEGFLIPMEDAIRVLTDIFAVDMPRTVRDAIEEMVRRIYARAEEQQSEADRAAGKVVTVQGDQVERALEIQVESFTALTEILKKAAADRLSGATKKEVFEGVLAAMREVLIARSSEGLDQAFFGQVSLDNLLAPLFDALEFGLQEILAADTPREARQATSDLLDLLNTDFEAVASQIEKLGPAIEAYADLQERLVLALTTFSQAADVVKNTIKGIDLLIAEFSDDPTRVQRILERQAQREENKAYRRIERIVGASIEDLAGNSDLSRNALRNLSDEDLKRLPGLIADATQAIVDNARLRIEGLQQELALLNEWINLLPQAKDALLTVRTYGRPTQQAAAEIFAESKGRLADLITQFRTGSDAERLAAAQQITALAPQILQQAQAAGFAPGSPIFEALRRVLDNVLVDIVNEGAAAQTRADQIQEEIRDIQKETRDKLEEMKNFARDVQAVLQERAAAAAEEIVDNTGDFGPPARTASATEKTFQILDRGINVKNTKGSFDPFEAPPLANGGLVTGTSPLLALLHPPELVLPLDKAIPLLNASRSGGQRTVTVNNTFTTNYGAGATNVTPAQVMLEQRKQRRMLDSPEMRALMG